MQYRIRITGTSPIIQHNGAAGLDTRSPANIEKTSLTKKKGTNRTGPDNDRIREIETYLSFWDDGEGSPTIPAGALRAAIETGARKLKQGTQVREGLLIDAVEKFHYDETLGTTIDELAKTVQFTTGVVVQRARILRTRAMFKEWGVTFVVEVDESLVDKEQLAAWLDIAGRRIGLGDWRPEKSGHYGRFETESIDAI